MSKEEEKPARVTRGALRRMSVDQEPTSAPGTPKLTAANIKKSAVLDAIQEGSTGPSDIEEDSTTKGKTDAPIGNKSVQKIKDSDVKLSNRTPTLNEVNMSVLENSVEVRRTPRRRPSQDSQTPHTVPAATRRKTRRNSGTSDDGNMPTTTPKASKSRLSVAPPTIAEDDEREDKVNSSSTVIAEAELSDLDIRKLRNRAISNSPVPRSSPSGKNTSLGSQKADEAEADTSKDLSPTVEPKSSESVVELSDENDEKTPKKSEDSKSTGMSPAESVKRQLKDVTFEEGTPNQLEKSVYPKTPIAPLGGKRRKLSEKLLAETDKSISEAPEVIDETVQESPTKMDQSLSSPMAKSPTTATPVKPETPNKADQSLDKSIDTLLANMAEEVRENINQVDQSMSILGTPKPIGKQKHLTQLREGTFSTPIAKLVEEDEAAKSISPASKSWSQPMKGSSGDKGIDVFSVRKQEETNRQENETKQLNESLKRKSLENKATVEDEEDEAEEEEEEGSDDNAPKRNSFVDEEAMEVQGYQSGDSLDSETREEIEAHEIIDDGESLGSKDSEMEEEEDEDDSFIASDNDEFELLDGSGDDLEPGKAEDKSIKGKKTHKRIIQHDDSTSEEEQSLINVNESSASESKSPKKSPKKVDLNLSKSPKKTPTKDTAETNSSFGTPKRTPSKIAFEENEQSSESLNISPKKTPTKSTPMKNTAEDQNQKTPERNRSQEKLPTPKSNKNTPLKISLETETEHSTSADEQSTEAIKMDLSVGKLDITKSRKSLPAPALISADFYASSKKTAKRATINALDVQEPSEIEEPSKNTNLVTNPAALALAKKNKKRLSLEASHVDTTSKKDKRSSLPVKLPVDTEIESPLKRKKKQNATPEKNDTAALDPVEPMDVDETEDVVEETVPKNPAQPTKKKPKDLSEFDTSAILARCNEIVRSDKEKRKQGATLKQKKKDEKRRQREEELQEENAETNESTEQQKKKKKKKKKPINYLLEELGEKKEDQVAKALQRKMEIQEARRARKKAKKAARLHQQLNKENQQEEEGEKKEGIGSKFEKKTKKAKKKAKKEPEAIVEEEPKPVVKRAISAIAIYGAQIEELKKEQEEKKKPKRKLLKEKNLQPSATEEVQAALKSNVETKSKKNKHAKKPSETAPTVQEDQKEDHTNVAAEKEDTPEKSSKPDQRKKKGKTALDEPESSKTVQKANKKLKEDNTKPDVAEKPTKLVKKKEKSSVYELDGKQKSERVDLLFAPLKSVVSTNDDELALLKKSLMEPITKVAKKQKLSEDDSNHVTFSVVDSTPPRKLKAVTRLEKGFYEETVTPDHKLLKRNHGFKEEPVTPKTIGFKVSNVLPAGQEALQKQALLGKKKKIYSSSSRIRPEDVKEPAKGLPLPIWTRSGSFDVEEVSEAKVKKSKSAGCVESEVIPLNVNNGGQRSTDFLVKPLGSKKKEQLVGGGSFSKAHRIDLATVDESVINFKKQAIFGKNAHLREKKTKH